MQCDDSPVCGICVVAGTWKALACSAMTDVGPCHITPDLARHPLGLRLPVESL